MRKLAVLLGLLVLAGIAATVAFAASSNPSFSFSTDEPGATFTCKLDNGSASACSSPKNYTGLTGGAHRLTIVESFTVPTVAAPTAAFTYSPSSPVTGSPVHFDGSASTCPAGPCTYRYSDTTNNSTWGTAQSIDFTFQAVGTKHGLLTVTDAQGRTATVAHDVIVSNSPPPPPTPPANTAAPAISGTPQSGSTLTASQGTWTGSTPITYSYLWSDGATGQTDTLTDADIGKQMTITVTATNSAGSASATSQPTLPVTAAPPPPPPGSCDLHATTSSFASQFAAATAGQTLCLAPGSYGVFNGGSKSAPGVTITADTSTGGTQANVIFAGANLGGSSNLTLDTLTLGNASNYGVDIESDVTNIAVTNVLFHGGVEIDNIQSSNHRNVDFNHDDLAHTGLDCSTLQGNSVFGLHYSGVAHSGVTLENSTIGNTDCDGVHTGTAIDVLNNRFINICENGSTDPAHTDNIQFEGANGGRIAGNYISTQPESNSCVTQAITSFDGYTNGVVIENNVIDANRGFGVEWYSDTNSIIRHNTVPYRPSGCATGACGQIDINCRSNCSGYQPNAGTGTQVYDNLASITVEGGASLGRNDHNMSAQTVQYQGGSNPPPTGGFNAFSDYLLTATSPGAGAADDGLNIGITG